MSSSSAQPPKAHRTSLAGPALWPRGLPSLIATLADASDAAAPAAKPRPRDAWAADAPPSPLVSARHADLLDMGLAPRPRRISFWMPPPAPDPGPKRGSHASATAPDDVAQGWAKSLRSVSWADLSRLKRPSQSHSHASLSGSRSGSESDASADGPAPSPSPLPRSTSVVSAPSAPDSPRRLSLGPQPAPPPEPVPRSASYGLVPVPDIPDVALPTADPFAAARTLRSVSFSVPADKARSKSAPFVASQAPKYVYPRHMSVGAPHAPLPAPPVAGGQGVAWPSNPNAVPRDSIEAPHAPAPAPAPAPGLRATRTASIPVHASAMSPAWQQWQARQASVSGPPSSAQSSNPPQGPLDPDAISSTGASPSPARDSDPGPALRGRSKSTPFMGREVPKYVYPRHMSMGPAGAPNIPRPRPSGDVPDVRLPAASAGPHNDSNPLLPPRARSLVLRTQRSGPLAPPALLAPGGRVGDPWGNGGYLRPLDLDATEWSPAERPSAAK